MIPRQRYTSEVVDFLPLYFLDTIRERYRCQGIGVRVSVSGKQTTNTKHAPDVSSHYR